MPSSRDLPSPGIEPRSSTLQADSLPAEPPGKPENTGMGSLSFLPWIFLTQESNQGLLHCKHFISWATREAHERQTSKVLAYLGQNNFPAVSLTLWTTATLFRSQQTTVSLAVESVGFGIMQTWYWPCLSYSVLLHGIFIQTYMSITHRGPCEECTLTTAFEANVDLRFHSRNQEGIHIMPPKVINVSISDIYHLPNPFLAFLDIMIFSLSFIQCPASLTPFLSTLSLFIFSSILLHRWVPSRSPAQQHKNFTR